MLDEATRRLVGEVGVVAENVGAGALTQRADHEREILALFHRCRSTFGAVWVLTTFEQWDFGQEAAALTRSLVTESLMLMELAVLVV